MEAVYYLRMSRDIQERSIDEQRDSLSAYAKTKGYNVIGEYADEGISGDSTEKRVGFQKMMHDCQFKRFELILCWDQDRFGRFDPIEAGYWIRPMRAAGIMLETIAQGRVDWNDFAGRLVWSVQQESKHAFLRDIARNTLRGNLARVRSGKFTGRAPFGYVVGPDGVLTLGDDDEVETVRRVFELRKLEFGYRLIAKKLRGEGRIPPSGGEWSLAGVRSILERELYTGTIVFGRRHRGKYSTSSDGTVIPSVGKTVRNKSPLKIPNAHPPIIDAGTWDAVSRLRGVTIRPHTTFGKSSAPFAGLLVCGLCGQGMYSSGEWYICSSYTRGRGCHHCRVKQKAIHGAVFETLRDRYCGGSVDKMIQRAKQQVKEYRATKESASKSAALAKLEKQIASATDRLLSVDDRLFKTLEKQVLALRDKRDRLASEIASTNDSGRRFEVTMKAVWEVVAMESGLAGEKIRAVIRGVVNRIELTFTQKRAGRANKFECTEAKIVFQNPSEPALVVQNSALL